MLQDISAAAVVPARPGSQGMPASISQVAPAEAAAAAGAIADAARDAGAEANMLRLVFAYDSRLWLKANSSRQIKEGWRECEKRLKVSGRGS